MALQIIMTGLVFGDYAIKVPDFTLDFASAVQLLKLLDDPKSIKQGLIGNDGSGGFFGGINVIANGVESIELPLIGGEQFDSLANQLRSIQSIVMGDEADPHSLISSLNTMIENGETSVSEKVISFLKQALFNGLNDINSDFFAFVVPLLDGDGNRQYGPHGKVITKNPTSAEDIQLTLNSNGELTFNLMFGGALIGEKIYLNDAGNQVVWENNQWVEKSRNSQPISGDTSITSTAVNDEAVALDFSVGIAGLGLSSDANISTQLDYLMGIGLGISGDGVFLDTSGVNEEGEEIALDVSAVLADGQDADGNYLDSNIEGQLGFLKMDLAGTASLIGHLGVDLIDETSDGKLFFGAEELELVINANAQAQADFLANASTVIAGLPKMSTRIEYDQLLGDTTWSSDAGFKLQMGDPEVILHDVTLDAGSIMDSFLGESLSVVKDIIQPMKPVIDLLTMEIDLGITKVMLIDMAYLRLPADVVDNAKKIIQVFKTTLEFIDSLDSVNGKINFGTFDLTGSFLEDENSTVSSDDLKDESGAQKTAPTGSSDSINNAKSGPNQKGLDKDKPTKSFRLPILDDPATALGLLTGKAVDLFWYDLPDLDLEFGYSKSYPVFPGLNAGITGKVGIQTNFDFGFDTSGFIEFQERRI